MKKIVIREDNTILDALKRINKIKYKFLIVSDKKDKIVGVLTIGDIIRFLINGNKLENKIRYAMNKNFIYLEKYKIEEIIKIFENDSILFIPIIKSGKISDIIIKDRFYNRLLGEKYDVYSIKARPWGFYKVIFSSKYTKVKILVIYPGEMTSLQEHKFREENWIIVKGKGIAVIGESNKKIKDGDYIFIPTGCKHRIINTSKTNLILIEVQRGSKYDEDDIIRYSDKYGRL